MPFNREWWLVEQERQQKEEKWERELLEAMQASVAAAPPSEAAAAASNPFSHRLTSSVRQTEHQCLHMSFTGTSWNHRSIGAIIEEELTNSPSATGSPIYSPNGVVR